jgi:hypothetical protein
MWLLFPLGVATVLGWCLACARFPLTTLALTAWFWYWVYS